MKLWPFFSRKANSDGALRHSADLFAALYGGLPVKSGASVTTQSALEVTTVLACARVIAEGLAQVPYKLYRKRKDAPGSDSADEHPLYDILHTRPNDWTTSYTFIETMAVHCVLTGNAVAYVGRDMRGRITELIPIAPGNVTIKQNDDYSLTYTVVAPNGSSKEFPQRAIWHWRGPSWDGVTGLNAVRYAREAIGLAMVTEESQAKLHANGMRVSGMYSMDAVLKIEQYRELRAFLDAEYGGAANANKPLILDRKAEFHPTTMTGVDSQHLETRRYQVEEICRAFRVMPIMIGYSDKAATYASAEQMFLAHVVHTLAPWYRRIEQSADTQLLTTAERGSGLYTKFVAAGLLRGALKDTSEYLVKLTTNGIMTRNEARDKLELNPLAGLDEPLTPTNLTGSEPAAVPAGE